MNTTTQIAISNVKVKKASWIGQSAANNINMFKMMLTFNDYPVREYTQVSGSAWFPSLYHIYKMKESDIVFSSSKDEAVFKTAWA
jgi:hypothetical protein